MIQQFSYAVREWRGALAIVAALLAMLGCPARVMATPPATAAFISQDTSTQGNWKGVYGADGWNVIGDTSANNPTYPSYATVTPGPHNSGVWYTASLGPGALQSATVGSTTRVAGVWFQTGWSMSVNVTGTHQIALYLLDVSNHGYGETITISDAVSHTVLDTESASSFSGGVYFVWSVHGNVRITFTATAAHWAVLSGIFFGTTGSTAPATPTGLTATSGSKQVGLSWTAAAGATSYNVYRGSTSGGESTTPIASGITGTRYTNTGLTNGSTYYYKVVGVNAVGGSIPSSEASATTSTAVASFVRADLASYGNWKAQYGGDGWNVFGDTSGNNPSYPTYATVTPGSHYTGLWSASTSAPSALQVVDNTSTNRVAGVWYRPSWSMNVNMSGWHQMALYLYDYANAGYAETITISDAVTGAVLDTRSASSFATGAYYVWDIQGNVTVTFASTSGSWAVLSGIFFGNASELQVPDVPTQLVATPSSGQVSLTWAASNRAVTYNVYRGTASGHESASAIATGLSSPAFTDTGLPGGGAYYYVVNAVNVSGLSSASNEAKATTPLDVPTNLNAGAGNGQIGLTWAASSNATSYNVYRGTSTGAESATPIATGVGSPTYTDTGLTNGTTYYYTVKAVTAAATSAASSEASATPAVLPDGIYTFTDILGYYLDDPNGGGAGTAIDETNSTGASQQWTITRISGNQYKITIAGGVALTGSTLHAQLTLATYTGAGNQLWTIAVNPDDPTYYYINNVGTSENIDDFGGGNTCAVGQWDASTGNVHQKWTITATTQVVDTPTSLTATPGNGQVGLTWNASSGAISYNVYRGTSTGGESATPIVTGLESPTYTDTGLSNGTTYYYAVKGVYGDITSAASNEASATPVILTDGLYHFTDLPGKDLNDPSGGGDGTGVTQVTYSGIDQQWDVTRVSGNQYKITTAGGFALTGANSRSQLTVATYTGASNQLWTFAVNPNDTSYCTITNIGTGENIDDWGGNPNLVGQWDFDLNEPNQKWTLTPVALSAPTANAVAIDTQVTLFWPAAFGASSYNVYRGTTPGGESGAALATGIGGLGYVDTSVSNGTTYYYTVMAVNPSGSSAVSNEASATPQAMGAHNVRGIDSPGTSCPNGGIDGGGHTIDSTLLGQFAVWNGQFFTWPAPNQNNFWTQSTINYTGSGDTLYMLAFAVNGRRTNQQFVVTYTDSSTSTFTQSMSDWASPQNYSGETTVMTMSTRLNGRGDTDDQPGPYRIFGYSFPLDAGKTVQSLQLPNDNNEMVLAISIGSAPG